MVALNFLVKLDRSTLGVPNDRATQLVIAFPTVYGPLHVLA